MTASRLLFDFENLFENFDLQLNIGNIFQVSEVSLEKGNEFFEHPQICDEITYAVSGQAKIYSGSECETLSAEQIHFIRKGVNHRIVALPDQNFRYICIGFVPNPKSPDAAAFLEAVSGKDSFVINDNGYIKKLAELVIREFYSWDDQSPEIVDKFITLIVVVMRRILNNSSNISYSRKEQKGFSNVLYEVVRYIDREYLRIDSIKKISAELSYSEYYLSHLFKEKMGITMKEYLNRKKITHAMELLRYYDLTIEQISDHLNFASSRVFRSVFKQYTGSTPSAYRDRQSAQL